MLKLSKPIPMSDELKQALEAARQLPPMTPSQLRAQARSWTIGQLGLMEEHKDKTREELEKLVDDAIKRSIYGSDD